MAYKSLGNVASGGGGAGVSSLNGETGAVNLVQGANITITPTGQNITIAASGGSGSIPQATFSIIG